MTTTLTRLRREKRVLLADMKTAGIRRMSCMNRMDGQAFHCNLELERLTLAIKKEKACPTPG